MTVRVRSNWDLFTSLVSERVMDLEPDAPGVLAALPAPPLAGPEVARRAQGMLLGLALGDALGNSSESMHPVMRNARFGRIRGYLPNRHLRNAQLGSASDDTQLTLWTLRHCLDHDGLDAEHLSAVFADGEIRGIGAATLQFQLARRSDASWLEAPQPSAGNGALMRIAGILPHHLPAGGRDAWADVALHAFITHNDRLAISSAIAFAALLRDLLGGQAPTGPEWWIDRYIELARPLEGDRTYQSRAADGPLAYWSGRPSDLIDDRVRTAVRLGMSVVDAQDEWHSGAYLLETLPTVLLTLARHGHDAAEAIEVAINDSWDNDTVGAIVGAAVGALHGSGAFPAGWVDGLFDPNGDPQELAYAEVVRDAVGRWCG